MVAGILMLIESVEGRVGRFRAVLTFDGHREITGVCVDSWPCGPAQVPASLQHGRHIMAWVGPR